MYVGDSPYILYPGPLGNVPKGLELTKSGFLAYIMQNSISSMMGISFLLPWGLIMQKFKILDGIFQLGDHQAQVLQASQAGRESTQLASPGNRVLSLPAWLAWSTWAWWIPS